MKEEVKKKIVEIILYIGFILYLGILIVANFAEAESIWAKIAMWQIFITIMIIGTICIFAKVWAGSVFFFVGCAMFIGMCVPETEVSTYLVTFFMGMGIASLGIGVFLLPVFLEKRKRERCTLEVDAKCISLERGLKGSRWPVWSYKVNGEIYTFSDIDFWEFRLPSIGSYCKLYVNPDDYNDIYRVSSKTSKIMRYICGIALIVIGGWAIFGPIMK